MLSFCSSLNLSLFPCILKFIHKFINIKAELALVCNKECVLHFLFEVLFTLIPWYTKACFWEIIKHCKSLLFYSYIDISVRQQGHSCFFFIHITRQTLWKRWWQGVIISSIFSFSCLFCASRVSILSSTDGGFSSSRYCFSGLLLRDSKQIEHCSS